MCGTRKLKRGEGRGERREGDIFGVLYGQQAAGVKATWPYRCLIGHVSVTFSWWTRVRQKEGVAFFVTG